MRSFEDMAEVRALLEAGVSVAEVVRRTGVPYSTAMRWKHGRTAGFGERVVARPPPPWRPDDPVAYAYLLGIYLGDGCLNEFGHSTQLAVALDGLYPGIVDEVVAAILAVRGPCAVYAYDVRASRCRTVRSSWKRWPEVFPQHGPGRKHERPIVLKGWQQEVVDAHPGAFLRGLIHSDGCRTVNRFSTRLPSGRVAEYAYARYFFSNRSADIRGLFCASCERLGIRWTQSNARNVSVAHRASVARLDELVGPKG